MVTENLQVNKVSVSCLQVRNGIYQAVLEYYDENGKRHQPWRSTGLKERGNKKQALIVAEELRENLEKELQLKVLDEIETKSNTNNTTDILFIEYLFYWLKIIEHTIESSTFTSYRQISNNHIKRYFTGNPIKLKDLEPIHIQNFYNEAELNKLFEISKDDPLELIILITAFYGLRRSEVLGLQWDSFDFENKTITIKHTITITNTNGNNRKIEGKDRTKNKSSYRTLPLFDDIANMLLKAKEIQEAFKKAFGNSYNKKYLNYVFVKPDGNIVRPDYVTEHFSILLKKNKMKHIRFHDLRHSCASLLLAKGIPMKSIQEWLGHSNFSTTANLYAHLDTNSKRISANVLEDTFKLTDKKKENEESTSSSSQNN